MGIDASVRCRCWQDGTSTPAPIPVHLDEAGELQAIDDDDESWHRVVTWQENACPHPHMDQACERISNYGGYRAFEEALRVLGWNRFPSLHGALPQLVSPSAAPPVLGARALARACLEELRLFEKSYRASAVGLFDDAHPEEPLHTRIDTEYHFLVLAGAVGIEAGFDEDGIYFIDRATNQRLFRARKLLQRIRNPKRIHDVEPGMVDFIDLDTGKTWASTFGLQGAPVPWPDGRLEDDRGRSCPSYPLKLSVRPFAIDASHFEYILTPLKVILTASIVTDNPIRWF